ncbi:alpha/beta hydrolase [Bacteroides sp. 51]|uniref:alpha/beta hydrolase n=1 Tax=Bacteroides sp. 51 TaxID=2302938 RepID=UPI0013D62A53|nr:alpha/beta hydrolase [Bacteroides sp. 51]NDV83673.1 alpha/beta hydrolase [Bacteroides sp. 51]
MKLKRLSLTGLLLIPYICVFSQSVQLKKQEFVYKTVKGHEIKANVFLPNSGEKHPVLIYFHGGGFIFGNRDQGLETPLKEKFVANGYAVVSADYRLAPETKLDEIITDVSDVIKWIRLNGEQKYNMDTGKIVAAGGSAGGYLALTSAFNADFMPDAIVAISSPTGFSTANMQMGDLAVLSRPGPYDIVKDSVVSYGNYDSRIDLWRFLGRNRLALYEIFGFDPAEEPEKLKKYTLTDNIRADFPPTLIIHARNDRLVGLQEVSEFYDFLAGKQINAELHLVENGHSSELIRQHPEVVEKIIEFLKAI